MLRAVQCPYRGRAAQLVCDGCGAARPILRTVSAVARDAYPWRRGDIAGRHADTCSRLCTLRVMSART